MNEPIELLKNSALSLLPSEARKWLPSKNDEGGWYAMGLNEYFNSVDKTNMSPKFLVHRQCDGSQLYEAQAGWGKRSCRVTLTSGICASTLEAMEKLSGIVEGIPSEKKLNWRFEMDTRLGFNWRHGPVFTNTVPIGIPQFTCCLVWGSSNHEKRVISGSKLTRFEAFEEAMALAKIKGGVPAVVEPALSQHSKDWNHEALRQLKGALPKEHIKVTFPPIVKSARSSLNEVYRPARVLCKIQWGKNFSNYVESIPSESEEDAFMQAVGLLKKAVDAWREKNKVAKASPKRDVIQPDSADGLHTSTLDASTLLSEAKRRWDIERNWLMRQSPSKHSQVSRLHRLNTFLVILDPLRRLEIEHIHRNAILKNLGEELSRIAGELSPKYIETQRASYLRKLFDKLITDVGQPASVNAAFSDAAKSRGLSPDAVISDLVESRLLRKSIDGKLSLSTLGANVLEREVTRQMHPGTLAGGLPSEIVAMLMELRETLERDDASQQEAFRS